MQSKMQQVTKKPWATPRVERLDLTEEQRDALFPTHQPKPEVAAQKR